MTLKTKLNLVENSNRFWSGQGSQVLAAAIMFSISLYIVKPKHITITIQFEGNFSATAQKGSSQKCGYPSQRLWISG